MKTIETKQWRSEDNSVVVSVVKGDRSLDVRFNDSEFGSCVVRIQWNESYRQSSFIADGAVTDAVKVYFLEKYNSFDVDSDESTLQVRVSRKGYPQALFDIVEIGLDHMWEWFDVDVYGEYGMSISVVNE